MPFNKETKCCEWKSDTGKGCAKEQFCEICNHCAGHCPVHLYIKDAAHRKFIAPIPMALSSSSDGFSKAA